MGYRQQHVTQPKQDAHEVHRKQVDGLVVLLDTTHSHWIHWIHWIHMGYLVSAYHCSKLGQKGQVLEGMWDF